jgi:hypothetical protein
MWLGILAGTYLESNHTPVSFSGSVKIARERRGFPQTFPLAKDQVALASRQLFDSTRSRREEEKKGNAGLASFARPGNYRG